MFGASNYIEVQNNKKQDDINVQVYKEIRKRANSKITSKTAKDWIENEKALIRARNPSGKVDTGFFAKFRSRYF
jgi:hypothetical protein